MRDPVDLSAWKCSRRYEFDSDISRYIDYIMRLLSIGLQIETAFVYLRSDHNVQLGC
jgi:phage gp29-like protein